MAAKSDHLKLVKQNKQMPRWKKTIRFLFRLTLLVGLVLLLKHGETFFRVNEIIVEGAEDIPGEAIMSAGNLEIGMSILFLKENKIAEAVMSEYPEINKVEITRILPESLVVSVTERTLAAYVIIPDGYWMIDRDAVCFAHTMETAGDYPVISGIDVSMIIPGEPLGGTGRRDTLRSFFHNWYNADLPEIEKIDFADSFNLIAESTEGWEIWLGDDKEMAYKLLLIQESIPYLTEGSQARLDVRSGKRLVVSSSSVIDEKEVAP
ncbi:MAG: cell division protein FtsQ/DivIB [Dethiobacteria bacterium]|nr:FtsQ-type POTRA domain-containing protein [Bacillota bacterium]